jgi:hypothetical protein
MLNQGLHREPYIRASRLTSLSSTLPQLCGLLAVAVGGLVIIGWYAHWPLLVQVLPGLVPMKFNTALGFVASGVALALLPSRQAWAVSLLGGIVALLGFLTLVEFGTGADIGIDQLVFRYYLISVVSNLRKRAVL